MSGSMSYPTSQLLRRCGFVEIPDMDDGFAFDLPGRDDHAGGLVQVHDGRYELLFPYRYPDYILRHYSKPLWYPTWDEAQDVFTRLHEHVTAAGNQSVDTAWYLYAYIACPRVDASDFSEELLQYTDADMLQLASMRHLDPRTFALLIEHLVPVETIRGFSMQQSLSLFLELYPSPMHG